ncbi:MAG: hypothetical protein J6B22_00870 [Clostridia bacterium]|nr:hypothetical protein [Clostridia bacterium]
MTVNDILKVNDFKSVVLSDGDREVSGVYIGDLLSWVMGKANSGDAWITIMSNVNILAVASLTDCACIILSEGVTLSDEIIATAKEKGINVLSFAKSSFDAAICLNAII